MSTFGQDLMEIKNRFTQDVEQILKRQAGVKFQTHIYNDAMMDCSYGSFYILLNISNLTSEDCASKILCMFHQ